LTTQTLLDIRPHSVTHDRYTDTQSH